MADVLMRSAVGSFRSSRFLLYPSSRMWSLACYLGTAARWQKVTERIVGTAGQLTTSLGFSKTVSVDTKKHTSCRRFLRRISSQSDLVLPSHVTTTQSHDLEKSPEYQPLHVIPFSLVQGGKTVAHLLLKRKPRRALVFVRAKVLAVELMKELEEYGLKCSSAEDAPSEETEDIETSLTVMTEGELETMESLMPVDLILLVQQPVAGKRFTLDCLKKSHAKVKPLDVVLLYAQNDLPFLSQMNTYVEVKRLNPPSFCNVPVLYQTEGLPLLPEESVVMPGRHLIEPPPPEITAAIAPKKPRFKVFHPLVPVRTKQSERYRLNDRAYIYVRAGSGGQGSSLFGGVGGDGGDVFVECVENATLAHFSRKENRRICAEHGTFFSRKKGKRQNTVRGRDIVIPVPVGTTVSTEEGEILGELEEVGSRILVAQGGRGGSPGTEGWCGEKGERGMIRLDLRLVADVALVGFPNAGKSSLLRAISRATPKTAHYAFTTMRPNIGIVEYEDHSQVSVADLPGLIEGASMNRGLGHTFLKHTEKARALALVVDIDGFQLSEKYPQRTALENVCILLKELILYDKELLDRPKMLIVTKLDRKGATSRFQALQQNLHSIWKPDALLQVLQEIHASGPTTQENTALLDLANELTGTSFESIISFSAVTSYGLENVREKLQQLTLTRSAFIEENEIQHSRVY